MDKIDAKNWRDDFLDALSDYIDAKSEEAAKSAVEPSDSYGSMAGFGYRTQVRRAYKRLEESLDKLLEAI